MKTIQEQIDEKKDERYKLQKEMISDLWERKQTLSPFEYDAMLRMDDKITNLSDELVVLKSQLKEQQCHAIYEKVKEANTPDKRTFEEAEKESGGNNTADIKNQIYSMLCLRFDSIEKIPEIMQLIDNYASQFQEQPIKPAETNFMQSVECPECGKDRFWNTELVCINPECKGKKAQPGDEQYPKVELSRIFECEGLLYTIAIPEKASTETNLSHGRIICEIERT